MKGVGRITDGVLYDRDVSVCVESGIFKDSAQRMTGTVSRFLQAPKYGHKRFAGAVCFQPHSHPYRGYCRAPSGVYYQKKN